MIIGDKNRFAVEWKVTTTTSNWIYGYFFFYINGNKVGNSDEISNDLKGCRNWIRDFVDIPRDRYEPDLFYMPKEDVFDRLAGISSESESLRFYDSVFSRFHISYLGMSSFDEWTILLVKDEDGGERCIWRHLEGEIGDAYFGKNELESVLSGFTLE